MAYMEEFGNYLREGRIFRANGALVHYWGPRDDGTRRRRGGGASATRTVEPGCSAPPGVLVATLWSLTGAEPDGSG